MTHDPYLAPAAPLADRSHLPVAMYTPGQVGAGAFLGGPVALLYFVRSNFLALGDEVAARRTLLFGGLFAVAFFGVLMLLPDGVPNATTSVALMLAGYTYAERAQMTRQAIVASPGHFAHSGWLVFGMSLLCLAATLAMIAVPFFFLLYFRVGA
jgi:hypothetical protein